MWMNSNDVPARRILAIAFRARRFGFVAFEGVNKLLDYGVREYENDGRFSLEHRLVKLQSEFAPSLILARRAADRGHNTLRSTRDALRRLEDFAKQTILPVTIVEESSIRDFFSASARKNKHDVGQAIVSRYPELAWKLPPKRKPWQTEPVRQLIFDAASLGVFYFAQQSQPFG
jgi:hypothetical protein